VCLDARPPKSPKSRYKANEDANKPTSEIDCWVSRRYTSSVPGKVLPPKQPRNIAPARPTVTCQATRLPTTRLPHPARTQIRRSRQMGGRWRPHAIRTHDHACTPQTVTLPGAPRSCARAGSRPARRAAWPRPLDDGMNDAGRETTFFGPKRQSEERAAERSLAFTRHDRTRSVDDLY
jgi:hypothetical protein